MVNNSEGWDCCGAPSFLAWSMCVSNLYKCGEGRTNSQVRRLTWHAERQEKQNGNRSDRAKMIDGMQGFPGLLAGCWGCLTFPGCSASCMSTRKFRIDLPLRLFIGATPDVAVVDEVLKGTIHPGISIRLVCDVGYRLHPPRSRQPLLCCKNPHPPTSKQNTCRKLVSPADCQSIPVSKPCVP